VGIPILEIMRISQSTTISHFLAPLLFSTFFHFNFRDYYYLLLNHQTEVASSRLDSKFPTSHLDVWWTLRFVSNLPTTIHLLPAFLASRVSSHSYSPHFFFSLLLDLSCRVLVIHYTRWTMPVRNNSVLALHHKDFASLAPGQQSYFQLQGPCYTTRNYPAQSTAAKYRFPGRCPGGKPHALEVSDRLSKHNLGKVSCDYFLKKMMLLLRRLDPTIIPVEE
jgi:hypothetical protein